MQTQFAPLFSGPFRFEAGFPATCASGAPPTDLRALLTEAGAEVRDTVLHCGALLFRNTTVRDPATFEAAITALTPDLLSYVGGGSPRTNIAGKVFTSTELAAHAPIPAHCEASYLPEMPEFIWFFCKEASERGGGTPIVDMDKVAARLPEEVKERFRALGVLYVINLHGGVGFGKAWKDTYGADDKAEVEAILNAQGVDFEWVADDGLRVLMRQPTERPHPRLNRPVWVNQVVNWHPASLGDKTYARIARVYRDPIAFPKMAFYGDGSEIPVETINALDRALRAEEVLVRLAPGDVLLLDNRRIAHGREPFEGRRSVFVALA